MVGDWDHITKVDPDKEISQEKLDRVVESGTDALMISGTQGVTQEKLRNTLDMLEDCDLPKILEPSDPSTVLYDGFDDIYVPSVVNAKDPTWIMGHHKNWAIEFDPKWSAITKEAYIVLNPESAVGMVTQAKTDLTPEEVAAYATIAEKYYDFPIIYIEYSGTFGDPKVVKAVKEALDEAHLFYGGGIKSEEQARKMAEYADSVIVGNVIYEDDLDVYLSTVKGSKK
ncbi:MAG: phosphoglycerol geranylgeranyltransferase [Candidatus Aenigmatarchaeota archaeon]